MEIQGNYKKIYDRTEIKKRDESMEMVVNCEFVSQPLKKIKRISMVKIVQNQIRIIVNRVDATISIDTQCT